MTSDIVAAALAGLGPMIQQGSRKPVNQYAARRQFGDAQLMQGMKTAPVGSVVEGLSRALQGGLGGWMAGKADRDELADEEKKNATLMDAITKARSTGDFSEVARALASAGQAGPAATLLFADMAQQRQQGRAADTTRLITGAPDPLAPPVGGPPGSYDQRVAATESPFGATNPQSGAVGYFQLMPDTIVGLAQRTQWGQGVPPAQLVEMVKADPGKQRQLMTLYTQQSDATLTQAGIPVNDVTRFALHTFGPAGGVSLIKAPDNMPVGQWVQSVDWGRASPQQVIAQNGLEKYQTVGQLKRDFIARRIGGGPRAQAAPGVTPVANPPQPQVGVAPPMEGGGVDDSGQDRGMTPGFAPPTVRLPPPQRLDDGSAERAAYERLVRSPDAQHQALALKYYEMWQAKATRAQQAQIDAAGKEPPMMGRTDQGGVALVEGALDAERARAREKARGAGEVEYFDRNGVRYERNLATGVEKPAAIPNPPTESQGKTAARLHRMIAAGPTVDAFEAFGTQAGQRFLDNVPGGLGNYGQSKEYQKFRTAAEAWIVGHLRDDSGGAITKEEWAKYGPIYFPQPGDHADVVAFKRQLRSAVEAGMKEQTAAGFRPPARAQVATPGNAPAVRGAPLPNHVDALKANPSLAPQFDEQYGPGAAERALKGGR